LASQWTTPGFKNWMRVAIGSEKKNHRLLSLLLKIAAVEKNPKSAFTL
jgi:hypothetical protein